MCSPPKSLPTFHGTNHHLARWAAGISTLNFLTAECIYFSSSLQEHPCTLDFVSLFPKDILLHNEAQWLRCRATNRKVAGSIPAGVSEFSIDIKSFRLHYGPAVDSASNRNEYQDYFQGVKTAGA